MVMQVQETVVVAAPCIERSYAVYLPDIWGPDFFAQLSHSEATNDSSLREEHKGLKHEIKRMLRNNTDEPSQKLKLVDVTQRLGVAYHFKTEVEDELNKISSLNSIDQNDLHNVALRFRLLRQQGIKVSCDVFEEFKDGEGKFKESLIRDVEGLLSLYEASFLSIRGEDILDEAIAFTTTSLKQILPQLSSKLAEDVKHALNRPIRKSLPRLEARRFIPIYEQDESHNKTLLKFAKLDFNMLQEQHRKELKEIIEWWKNLDFKTKLPYARDRIVECYFWIMGIYFDPKYWLASKMLTKVIAMASIIDDTYDNYGTYEELVLFTDAIQRWDVKTIDNLPECMKLVFNSLNDVYDEIDEITCEDGRPYCAYYAKESMKRLVRYYLVETKWRDEKYVPTTEEYMAVCTLTTGFPMLAATSFLGMGEIATKGAFEWAFGDPKIITASSVLCRLMDDIVSHQFEQEREHVASSIECYVKHNKVAEEKVIKLFRKEIADTWKDMNEDCLKPLPVPMDLLERVMNLARVMDIMYKDDDGYRNSYLMKDYVVSLIKDRLT